MTDGRVKKRRWSGALLFTAVIVVIVILVVLYYYGGDSDFCWEPQETLKLQLNSPNMTVVCVKYFAVDACKCSIMGKIGGWNVTISTSDWYPIK